MIESGQAALSDLAAGRAAAARTRWPSADEVIAAVTSFGGGTQLHLVA
jgi:hypothetical protein